MPANIPFSSAGGLILSQAVSSANTLTLKDGQTSVVADQAAAFWAAIDTSKTDKGWESVSKSCAADTSKQVVVEVSGSGVFISAIAPGLTGIGDMTITVTIDGVEFVFIESSIATSTRLLVGAFEGYGGSSATTTPIGLGSTTDGAWNNALMFFMVPSAIQALLKGISGKKFNTSLKVEIQGSVNVSAGAQLLKAAAIYSTFIPKGL